MILTAKGKDVANENVLGTGKHTYELVSDWPDLPHSIQLGYTHGVAIDSQNRVYIFNQSASAMCVFDQDGKFIKTWNNGYDKGAHGLTLVKEAAGEFLWLCDYATQRVLKTTLDGEEVLSLKMPPMPDVYPTPDKYKPTNAAPIPDGDVYVADGYGQSWVHQYDKTGNYIRSWGGKGKEQGKFDCPHGIAIDKSRQRSGCGRRRPRQCSPANLRAQRQAAVDVRPRKSALPLPLRFPRRRHGRARPARAGHGLR